MISPIQSYGFFHPLPKIGSPGFLRSYNQGWTMSPLTSYAWNSKPYEQYLKSAATGIANFLKSALDVQGAAQKLTQKETSAFQARKAESSGSKKVSANASAGAALKTYSVKVNAVATAQTNKGTLLSGSDASVVSKGTHVFNLNVGGKKTKIQVDISENDTNEQALTKIRNAVNAAKTGVTASIETDKDTGKLQLVLRSDKTGTDSAFEVEDEVGGAMAATGVTEVAQQAANASYSVNGGPVKTSQSNTIELEDGKLTATLLAASAEAVNIQVKPDQDKIVSDVKDLVASYNKMIGRLKEAGGYLHPSIQRSLDSLVRSSAYEQIGIHRNADGTLRVSEDQLRSSLDSRFEMTKNLISGKYGLADRLASAAERYNEVPPSSLLNMKTRQVQQLAIYESSMQMVMTGGFSGWFFNMLY
jgi:flagellar capping protein FliD